MPEFQSTEEGKLYVSDSRYSIEPREVLRGWESFSGWYWFATEEAGKQDSIINGQGYENDQIYFGLVQGFEDEWGYFSEGELDSLYPKVWEIEKHDLPSAGRRD